MQACLRKCLASPPAGALIGGEKGMEMVAGVMHLASGRRSRRAGGFNLRATRKEAGRGCGGAGVDSVVSHTF